ncbi:hypothetical protein ABTJ98_22045, partial [Acinetobacter baumannii]
HGAANGWHHFREGSYSGKVAWPIAPMIGPVTCVSKSGPDCSLLKWPAGDGKSGKIAPDECP